MTAGEEREFDDLLLMLKETRGFDFSGYKRSTLMRRVGRRLEALRLHDYGEYRDYLELEPEEFGRLFDSLLINVTSFFRDPVAWQALREHALPALMASKPAGKAIRVWSAGCATGQEAYTLAMVLAEELGLDEFRHRVKIYATDLDDHALQAARAATYTDKQLADIPEDLRETYFNGNAFRRDLRRQVIFGRNDLTRDAPISRVDLLLSRNTLMYFNTETQLNILRRYHFALSDPGYLLLGKAEMLLNHSDRFEPVDLRVRLFKKIAGPVGGPRKQALPRSEPPLRQLEAAALAASPVAQIGLDRSGALAVINSRAEVLFGLNPRDIGRPFQDLELSYRPAELRSVIEKVQQELRPVEVNDVAWPRMGVSAPSVFDVSVVPLQEADGTLIGMAVSFSEVTRFRRLRDDLEQANRELEQAYEELQSLNEELETTNEELQSTNEELETTNEELQSTNEELETMNEELQSTNEELQQINDTLGLRSSELDQANAFVSSIVRSLGDAVAVLDTDLRVLIWSGGAEELWGMRADEAVGQAFDHLDIGLPFESLAPQLRGRLDGQHNHAEPLVLDAVNRRGRPAKVELRAFRLRDTDEQSQGLITVMNLT